MPKFNSNLKIGAGLLNEASKNAITTERFPLIPIEYINRNTFNKIYEELGETFSPDEILSLAENISEVGLQQNLVVLMRSDTDYLLISGHRRYAAIQYIIKNKMPRYQELNRVPCKVMDMDTLNIPLSTPEMLEEYALLSGNIDNRNKKTSQIIAEVERYNQLLDDAIQNGFTIDGKRRSYIANRLGLSETSTQRIMQITTNATENLKQAVKEEKVSIKVAAKLASEPEDIQEAVIEGVQAKNQPLTSSNIEQSIEQAEINQANAVKRAREEENRAKAKMIQEEKPDIENTEPTVPEPEPMAPLAKQKYRDFFISSNDTLKVINQLMKEYKEQPIEDIYNGMHERTQAAIERELDMVKNNLNSLMRGE